MTDIICLNKFNFPFYYGKDMRFYENKISCITTQVQIMKFRHGMSNSHLQDQGTHSDV